MRKVGPGAFQHADCPYGSFIDYPSCPCDDGECPCDCVSDAVDCVCRVRRPFTFEEVELYRAAQRQSELHIKQEG